MATTGQQPPVTINVDPDDAFSSILQRVRENAGASVVLVIPEHCPVLLTATEFRTLKDLADRERVALTLQTDDRLRNQLSSMFGIRNLGKTSERSAADGWRPPETMLGSARAYGTWKSAGDEDEDDDAAGPEPAAPRRRRRSEAAGTTATRRREPDDGDYTSLEYLDEPTPFLTARTIGSIAGAVVLVALLLFALAWYYMPAVRVDATLRQEPVAEQLLYSVAAPGATLPSDIAFTADAKQESATVEFTVSVPATGVDRTPDTTATGEVLMRNPGDAAVTVPAGTALQIFAGPSYTTDADVEVPAASGGEAGEASVAVTATDAGASGNAEAGLLTGQLPDFGVFYSNRDAAIEGGTDIEIKIATQDDLDKLQQALTTDLDRAAAEGWKKQLPEGQSVVAPSVETGEPTYQINNAVGDQVDRVTASGTVDATGLVFDEATVQQQTLEFFRTALQERVPDGFALDPDSVTLSEPAVIAEAPDNVQYQVEASGVAIASFNDGARSRLANDLAGKSWSGAQGRLDGVSAFETWDMETSPGWWSKRMPHSGDRVTIHVTAPVPGDGAPTPEPSPEEAGS